MEKTEYTFTFENNQERQFMKILDRLDPSEYTIVEPVTLVEPENPRTSDKRAVIEMDPECCLTFRMGMKNIVIRRKRTEEELAEEKALLDSNKVTIRVQVPMSQSGSSGTP